VRKYTLVFNSKYFSRLHKNLWQLRGSEKMPERFLEPIFHSSGAGVPAIWGVIHGTSRFVLLMRSVGAGKCHDSLKAVSLSVPSCGWVNHSLRKLLSAIRRVGWNRPKRPP